MLEACEWLHHYLIQKCEISFPEQKKYYDNYHMVYQIHVIYIFISFWDTACLYAVILISGSQNKLCLSATLAATTQLLSFYLNNTEKNNA